MQTGESVEHAQSPPSPPNCHIWETSDGFTCAEVAAAIGTLEQAAGGSTQSFSPVPRDAKTEWLYERMLRLAERADAASGWGLLREAVAADDLIYDRFGPPFSAAEFRWHCDALPDDSRRRVSVVAYLTPPTDYAGGWLQTRRGPGDVVERRFSPGSAVAFPSRTLEHNVTPVTAGERRSLLLIVGCSAAPEREQHSSPGGLGLYVGAGGGDR